MVLIVLKAFLVSVLLNILAILLHFVSKECECDPLILLMCIFFSAISVRYSVILFNFCFMDVYLVFVLLFYVLYYIFSVFFLGIFHGIYVESVN
jgi:hypothetical protein